MSTEIIIPKERTYKIQPGHYRAKIEHVTFKKAKGSEGQNCCIHFIAQVPGMERYDCCARAIFPLDLRPGSQLRTFLEGLLGKQYFAERTGLAIDLSQVVRELDCEIDVIHGPFNEEKYDWPMVMVVNTRLVTPPIKPQITTKEEPTTK